jgi:hypothetical protein
MAGQNIQSLGAGGLYGNYTSVGGGGTFRDLGTARDPIDFARMGSPGQTPEAQYPDGYIGSGTGGTGSRREDRLANTINDLNRRPYTRGVHKGERIDPADYLWPSDMQPNRSLMSRRANSMRTPLVGHEQPVLVRGGKDLPPPMAVVPDEHRQGQLSHLRPPWS